MSGWVEDHELAYGAQELANVMLTMLSGAGLSVNIPGYSNQEDVDVFRESIWADAEDYMAMNPGSLEEEYNEVMRAAAHLVGDSPSRAYLQTANAILAEGWDGEAADQFAFQMTYIEEFIDQQQLYIATSAQAVAMMYAISVQFRESIHDLQVQTTSVCRSMIGKQGNSKPQWKALLVDVIQDISNIVSGKAAADLAKWAIDKTLSLVKEQVKGEPVRGDDERAVLNGYLDAREELRASYNKNLERIREWVDGRREEFESLKLMLREPLKKSITDVDSPDFSYEHFHYADHDDPSIYAPEVEGERQKYVDEKPKPGGLISQRLDGEE